MLGRPAIPKDADALKLFVGQIPKQSSEDELRPYFEAYGPVAEFAILRDKGNISKGCAFLTFATRSSALACMDALHDKCTMPGMAHALQIKPADSEQRAEDRKLFVGMIPKGMSEDQLRQMFAPYGAVEDVAVLQSNGVGKGCAFVKMDTRVNAQRAIDNIHGRTTMEGCRHPIVVKYADTEKEKLQKRSFGQPPFGAFGGGMNPMLMYQQMASMGGMGAGGMPHGMAPAAGGMGMGMGGQGMGMAGGMGAAGAQGGMGGMQGNGSGYDLSQALIGMQQFAGMGQQPYQQSPLGAIARAGKDAAEAQRASGGPEGANLFIYHLPPEFNDSALGATFMPFGKVVSAKVFIDKNTGLSKGFGFVSYDSPQAAVMAIQAMNGFQIGHKRLKVELKRPRGTPY